MFVKIVVWKRLVILSERQPVEGCFDFARGAHSAQDDRGQGKIQALSASNFFRNSTSATTPSLGMAL